MIDVLAVAHAPFTAINRRPYAGLRARGWSVEMAIPRRLPSLHARDADPIGPKDPPIHWVGVEGGNSRYWRFTGLGDVLDARRPRCIILENEPDSRIAHEVGVWARRHGARLILISNENDLPPLLDSALRGRAKPFARTLRSRIACLGSRTLVDHVFSICDDGVDAIARLGFAGRVSKMPLGFDPEVFKPDPAVRAAVRAELGLEHPVVAYIGRMVAIKGVDILLDALSRLADVDWHLLIDDFHDESAFGAIIRQRLETDPILAARTKRFKADHVQVARFMNAADIIVAPSVWKEQYGRVVPEAMACGVAVVVSDIGALPELVEDCGVVVQPGDPDALADGLRALMAAPKSRMELGRAAAERARIKLSLPVQIDCMEAVLKKLTSTGSTSVDASRSSGGTPPLNREEHP